MVKLRSATRTAAKRKVLINSKKKPKDKTIQKRRKNSPRLQKVAPVKISTEKELNSTEDTPFNHIQEFIRKKETPFEEILDFIKTAQDLYGNEEMTKFLRNETGNTPKYDRNKAANFGKFIKCLSEHHSEEV